MSIAFVPHTQAKPFHHVLNSQQFDLESLERLFEEARVIRSQLRNAHGRGALASRLQGMTAVNLFYEPSTRTRLSFEFAQQYLGMHVRSTENAREFSSAAKGETLEDTIRVICGYRPDVIVLRHYEDGAAERAAAVSEASIINAGDGKGQHPTQSLLDLFTIEDELGSVDGRTVVIGGDLKHGRTARSLAYLLSKYRDVRIVFVSPDSLRISQDILDHLDQQEIRHRGIRYEQHDSLQAALPGADVVYWTRVQKERMESAAYQAVSQQFVITSREMNLMKERSILLHPLPRIGEIAEEVDSDPRAAYFRQAENGLFVRMALLVEITKRRKF